MFIRTIIIMFVIFGVSLIAVPESAQIRGAVTAAPKKITCSKCGQKYNEGTRHVCPQSPQPQQKTAVCDLCKKQYTYKNDVHFVLGGGHKTITKCRTCGESFWACPNKPQGNHVCRGPVIVEGNNWDKPQFVNCRNCGQRVRQDQLQNHRCP
ncbi:MAG: hypothetical protein FWE67_11480, partial [Planctomycetaceae bacterium]|nr:hypothetical protein [Planctomycetaceae bacterium]